jgi:hypothetical protein
LDNSDDKLKKVHIDLPNHWAIGGESFWATDLGNDLYRLENVPFHAYGLNFLDVVRATPDSDETIPEIREVLEPSGRKTIRVLFNESVDRERQGELLDTLEQFEASYERADSRLVAIDIKPEGSIQAVFDQLEAFAADDILGFETCEPRAPGSFDDVKQEDSAAS